VKRKRTKLLTTGSAKWPKQLTKPCSDCPFRRESLRGWLGGETPQAFRACAHSDAPILCHVDQEWHCAGAAIYRANVVQRDAPFLLPPNKDIVFDHPDQFVAHHTTGASK
jgi:hypothetical protein